MFNFDDKKVKEFERQLEKMAKRAFPFATRQALNDTAFHALVIGRKIVDKKMILRNKWTLKSLGVEKTRTLDMRRQETVIGSRAEYMERQEFGGVKRTKGRHGVAIPTPDSSGEGTSGPRRRMPKPSNAMRNIRLRHIKTGRGNEPRNMRAGRIVSTAAQERIRFVFLDLGRTKGVFRISGSKKRPRVRLMASTSKKYVRIQKNPWLWPTAERASKRTVVFYRKALRIQLQRIGAKGI